MEPHHDAGEMLLPTEETAELIYESFVDAVTSISVWYLQLIGNSPIACALRSVLIGRAPTATTTWEEFMVTRLRFDLPIFSFAVDPNNGVFSAAPRPKPDSVTGSHSTGYKLPKDLEMAIQIILSTYSTQDSSLFHLCYHDKCGQDKDNYNLNHAFCTGSVWHT
jgi:hypothetical protein